MLSVLLFTIRFVRGRFVVLILCIIPFTECMAAVICTGTLLVLHSKLVHCYHRGSLHTCYLRPWWVLRSLVYFRWFLKSPCYHHPLKSTGCSPLQHNCSHSIHQFETLVPMNCHYTYIFYTLECLPAFCELKSLVVLSHSMTRVNTISWFADLYFVIVDDICI